MKDLEDLKVLLFFVSEMGMDNKDFKKVYYINLNGKDFKCSL